MRACVRASVRQCVYADSQVPGGCLSVCVYTCLSVRFSLRMRRVAHAARKHLLLASAIDENVESAVSTMGPHESNGGDMLARVTYVTLAPESVKMKRKVPFRSTLGRPSIALLRHKPQAHGSAV